MNIKNKEYHRMKQFNKSVYLAGAITYFYKTEQPERATAWRDKAEKFFADYNIKCFNPCVNTNGDFSDDMIVKQNIYYLNQCDIILVDLTMINDSVGTIFELTTAQNNDKLVVAFGHTHWEKRPHMQYLIDVKFDTLDEALEHITTAYNQ